MLAWTMPRNEHFRRVWKVGKHPATFGMFPIQLRRRWFEEDLETMRKKAEFYSAPSEEEPAAPPMRVN